MTDSYTYADIVKGLNRLNELFDSNKIEHVKYNKIFTFEYNIKIFNARITILLNKIMKYNKSNKNYTFVVNEIKKRILNCPNTPNNIICSIIKINSLVNKFRFKKTIEINELNPNHMFVAENIVNIIKEYSVNNNNNYTNYHIADIGGGEGDILKYISQLLNIPFKNLYCIEQEMWSNKYKFNNNINYLFWDNITFNLSNDIDLFLLIVSMHHMTDDTINNVLLNISKKIKKNGLIIIKEHDMTDKNILNVINWEHHLHHIMMSENNQLTEAKLQLYIDLSINNFKSKKKFDEIFLLHNFIPIVELDRQFNILIRHDKLNSTNLYWKIYKKFN